MRYKQILYSWTVFMHQQNPSLNKNLRPTTKNNNKLEKFWLRLIILFHTKFCLLPYFFRTTFFRKFFNINYSGPFFDLATLAPVVNLKDLSIKKYPCYGPGGPGNSKDMWTRSTIQKPFQIFAQINTAFLLRCSRHHSQLNRI